MQGSAGVPGVVQRFVGLLAGAHLSLAASGGFQPAAGLVADAALSAAAAQVAVLVAVAVAVAAVGVVPVLVGELHWARS